MTRNALSPIISLVILASTQTSIVRPIDEAPRSRTLTAFRSRLLRAIERRDTAAVLATVAPNIGLGFGGDAGIDEFRGMLKLPATWRDLHDILTHGGTFGSDSTFYAPYWCNVIHLSVDAFEAWIVIDSAVPVRSAPRVAASVVTSLTYAVVRKDRSVPGTPGWEPITLADGRHGWVNAAQLRSPIGMRVGLFRKGGRWWLGSYFGGD